MSDDPTNGIATRILDEVLALGKSVGRLEEAQALTNKHLEAIDARLELGSASMHELGTASATQAQQLARHDRSISALYQRVDATENTGVTHILEERTRWRTLRWIAVIFVGAVSVCATITSLIKCEQQTSAVTAAQKGK